MLRKLALWIGAVVVGMMWSWTELSLGWRLPGGIIGAALWCFGADVDLLHRLHSYLKHVRKVLEHKRHVWTTGRRLRVPVVRLLKHDLSKLGFLEAEAYSKRFYGDWPTRMVETCWRLGWHHHVRNNDHHWEHWVLPTVEDRTGLTVNALEMPEVAAREMVADWLAASRSYEGHYPINLRDWGWYQQNYHGIRLHHNTRNLVDRLLQEYLEQRAQHGQP